MEKQEFHFPKTVIDMNDVDNDKILVYNKFLYRKSQGKKDFRYFIAYKNDENNQVIVYFTSANEWISNWI